MQASAISASLLAALLLTACATKPTREEQPAVTPASITPASLTPFLMFQGGRAEEAINRYIEIFEDGAITSMTRFGPEGPGPEGTVMHAIFEIRGQQIMAHDSPIEHDFDFTPAISFFVEFQTAEELDRVFAALADGGAIAMPLDNYGFSERFGWVQDRFGVSWQLNLPSPE